MVSLPESDLVVAMEPIDLICGVDEAGRGPWAGPVTAGAVILDPDGPIEGWTDSKKLSEKKRLALEPEIKSKALAWAVVHVEPEDIDRINIREATFEAMRRAILGLELKPTQILIDGNALPASSAASILAITARDRLMLEYDAEYPEYGFAGHKGYGTAAHSKALTRFGPCKIHRMTFAPVRKALSRAA